MKLSRTVLFSATILCLCLSFCPKAEAALNWFGGDQKPAAQDTPKQEQAKQPSAPVVGQAPPGGLTPDQNHAALMERVANNKSLTDADKVSLAEAMLKQVPADANLRDKAQEVNMLFFEQIANDPNMKVDEKRAALQKHFSEPQPEAKTEARMEPKAQPKEEKPEKKEIEKAVIAPQEPKVEKKVMVMKEVKAEAMVPAKAEVKKQAVAAAPVLPPQPPPRAPEMAMSVSEMKPSGAQSAPVIVAARKAEVLAVPAPEAPKPAVETPKEAKKEEKPVKKKMNFAGK